MPTLSVILPCYNPLPDWVDTVVTGYRQLATSWGDHELIVVNDGSTTPAMAADLDRLQQRLPDCRICSYVQNRGKGFAVRTGMEMATGDWILYTDVDFPYTSESILRILETLALPECDVAVGVKSDAYYTSVPSGRRRISKVLRALSARLLRLSISDTQCGLKALRRKALPYYLQGFIDRYLFDLECLRRCERNGMKLLAVPVQLRAGIVFPPVRFSLLAKECFNFLKILMRP
jgi:glycosyltransferase involved in cell wall biosynthesis